jgi:Fic family protein
MEQVADIIDGKKVLGPPDEILEVKNAFAAYKELENIDAFDMKDMLRIHRMMMDGPVEENGRFRTVNAGVYTNDGHAIHNAPQPSLVPGRMKDLFDWLRTSEAHMLIKSSVFHYEFEFIHPFRDGNGRMGRFWQTAILMKWRRVFAWIPVESIIRERQAGYYDAIASSTKNVSSNEFVIYMLKAIRDAVEAIVSDAHAHINHINARVRELLAVLKPYPQSAAQLMERLGLRSRDAFRNNYLRPAIEAGLVSLTEPDKPTSKNQGYFRR